MFCFVVNMRVFPLIALLGISFAQSNLTAILESMPTCAVSSTILLIIEPC
jgi:hypothetical protein